MDALLEPPGKAYTLLTNNLIFGKLLLILVNRSSLSLPRKSGFAKPSMHNNYKPHWFAWVVIFMKHILSVMAS